MCKSRQQQPKEHKMLLQSACLICYVCEQSQQQPQDQEMLRGKGPRGLRAASMAAGQVQNPNLMGQHIVVSLPPGASKVCLGACCSQMIRACRAVMLLEARLHHVC